MAFLLVVIAFWVWMARAPHYEYVQNDLPADFETFYQQKLAESAAKKARPGNEEKLIRFAPKTNIAFLYIHGFTASRAEGEYVMDSIANLYQANTYYLRLPGHGTNKEDHAATKFSDYLTTGMDALQMVQQLGVELRQLCLVEARGRAAMNRVIIIGPCGSGKSTLARELAPRMGLPLIHMDQLGWQAAIPLRAGLAQVACDFPAAFAQQR